MFLYPAPHFSSQINIQPVHGSSWPARMPQRLTLGCSPHPSPPYSSAVRHRPAAVASPNPRARARCRQPTHPEWTPLSRCHNKPRPQKTQQTHGANGLMCRNRSKPAVLRCMQNCSCPQPLHGEGDWFPACRRGANGINAFLVVLEHIRLSVQRAGVAGANKRLICREEYCGGRGCSSDGNKNLTRFCSQCSQGSLLPAI